MAKENKSFLSKTLPTYSSTHATLLALIGGYLVYSGCKMIQNTRTGISSLDMTTTYILAGLMTLAGAAVLGYGFYIWKQTQKRKKVAQNVQEESVEKSENTDENR